MGVFDPLAGAVFLVGPGGAPKKRLSRISIFLAGSFYMGGDEPVRAPFDDIPRATVAGGACPTG